MLVCIVSPQADLYRRLQSKDSDNKIEQEESSSCDTVKLPAISSSCESYAEKSATVDATEPIVEESVPVQKSDSDEGDFEFISNEPLDDMADMQNGAADTAEEGDTRRISVSEDAEANDKFPQQMAKKSSWNTMELGEKRKRLR